MKSLIDKFPRNKTRYGVIVYGDVPSIKRTFQDTFPDDSSIKTFIDNVPRATGGSNLEKALEESLKLFKAGLRTRPKHTRILLIFTDTKSTGNEDRSVKLAKELDGIGVQIVVVPFGMRDNPKEIERIAPTRDNVITSDNADDPGYIAQRILERTSKG